MKRNPIRGDLIEGRTFGGIAGGRFVNESLDAQLMDSYGCTVAGSSPVTDDAIADCAICD